jgi:hypothetical protein
MDGQIYNPTTHVDGELGVVWTPYVFYENERLDHMGTNIFNMWQTKDRGWVIADIVDISREVDDKAFDVCGTEEAWAKAQERKREYGGGEKA